MDRALAANIPVSCLTLRVRKEIAKYLDVVDGVNGQRDYFGLGIHLLDLDLQDIKAMRNNYNGFSITELLLDEAAKRDISIKKLWDTLKKLDVHGCTEIEQDWSDIVAKFQTSSHGTENLDSNQSNCCCSNCHANQPTSYFNMPSTHHSTATDNNICNTFGTNVHLTSLDYNEPILLPENQHHVSHGNDLNSCITNMHVSNMLHSGHHFRCCSTTLTSCCSCEQTLRTPLNSECVQPLCQGGSEQTLRKTPLNLTTESVPPLQTPETIDWLPPSLVYSDTNSCNSHGTLFSNAGQYALPTPVFGQMSVSASNPSHSDHMQGASDSPTKNQYQARACDNPCGCETTSLLRQRSMTQPCFQPPTSCKRGHGHYPGSPLPYPGCPVPYQVLPMAYSVNAVPWPGACIPPVSSTDVQPCQLCKRNTAPAGQLEYLLVKRSDLRKTQSCSNPLQSLNVEDHHHDPCTNQKIQIKFNAKLPFVFITSGQRENGRWVDKLVKNLIARLEEDKINVVADLHEELYFSKDLMVGLVMEMECLESFSRYLLNKASCVIMGITPGYYSFVTVSTDSEDRQVEPSSYHQRVAQAYWVMYREFESNKHKYHRLFPVKLKSKKILTEDKHIPHWVQSIPCYHFEKDKEIRVLLDHLKQFFR